MRLDQEDVRLLLGAGTMLDAARHDEQVALPESDGAIAELDIELAVEHEKEVFGLRMSVPDEFALE